MPSSVSFAAGMVVAIRCILVISYSYLFWVACYAVKLAWGCNLGLGAKAQIEWRGQRGMLWCQFCRAAAFDSWPPDVLLIHLRGNDLAKCSSKSLILDITCDLRWLKVKYSAMQIIWSTIIPQLECRVVCPPQCINMA